MEIVRRGVTEESPVPYDDNLNLIQVLVPLSSLTRISYSSSLSIYVFLLSSFSSSASYSPFSPQAFDLSSPLPSSVCFLPLSSLLSICVGLLLSALFSPLFLSLPPSFPVSLASYFITSNAVDIQGRLLFFFFFICLLYLTIFRYRVTMKQNRAKKIAKCGKDQGLL